MWDPPNWRDTEGNPATFFANDRVLFDDTGISKTVAMQGMLSPATITFNNSAGNDYELTGGAGVGFTGPASLVKNGTGMVTLQGYSHNYTGTVTINDGVLRANGNEALGNASAVVINDSENGGGQLNINGMPLGSGTRHYSLTIAGDGPGGTGAITNTSGNNPYENTGFLNLTLAADASVGSTGGRYDIGRSGGVFGTITGNGFTLTKVGTGTVCLRAPATDITYVVAAGTLKFEDSNVATGTNAIEVQAGAALQAYGDRTFANTINLATGTTLDNDGGGSQTWTGPVNLTGNSVNLRARNGAITLTGAISGNANVTVDGNNILSFTGSASNTYTGTTTVTSTGQLVLGKTGGAVAIPGDLILAATGTRNIVSTTVDNQFGANTVLRFAATGDKRLELKGTTQTLAGIDNTGATGYNNIQHSEFGSPAAIDGVSDLIVNVADGNNFSYSGVLRDQGGRVNLVKNGPGTQQLHGGLIDFSGTTTVNQGRLLVNSDDTWTSAVAIAAGAVYEINVTSATDTLENRQPNYTLTGTGTFRKTGIGNLSMGWSGAAQVAMDSGALIEILEGEIRLEYGSQTHWTNNRSDLTIAPGAALNLWDNNNAGVFVDSLNGGGSVIRTHGVSGNLTVGVDDGSGDFSGSISNASGRTNVIKEGSGTQTLSGINTYSGDTIVTDGELVLADGGSLRFVVTDTGSNVISGTGTVTLAGSFDIDISAVTAENGTWSLVDTANLTVSFDDTFSPGAGWTAEGDGLWALSSGTQTWTFSEVTGNLTLGSGSSYASWIDGFFPGETDPSIISADADPDQDGLANAVELIVGGSPAGGLDTDLLPTLELVTDPEGLAAGDYLLFTYRRTDLSVSAGAVATFEINTSLEGDWTTVADGVGGAVILVDDDYTGFSPPAAATDRVRVFVPRDDNQRLFGRLRATLP
jgi:fibronectin-binding autotransporter adhesin